MAGGVKLDNTLHEDLKLFTWPQFHVNLEYNMTQPLEKAIGKLVCIPRSMMFWSSKVRGLLSSGLASLHQDIGSNWWTTTVVVNQKPRGWIQSADLILFGFTECCKKINKQNKIK